MDDRTRTTISLPPEVYEVFKALADAGGISVSRCMGDWLADTVDAAQLATSKMLEIRRTPERAMREYSLALAHEADRYMRNPPVRKRAVDAGSARAAARPAPSSLTGLNPPSPPKPKKGRS